VDGRPVVLDARARRVSGWRTPRRLAYPGAGATMGTSRRGSDGAGHAAASLLISKTWVQAAVLVTLCGFFILGLLAYRTYTAQPPIPTRVVDPQGGVVYTGRDISKGQQVFLHNGLMEYGSVFGHGAHLGPDYTADYLRRSSNVVQQAHGGPRSDAAVRQTVQDFRTNRYDERTGTLTLTAAQADSFRKLVPYYSRFFAEPTTRHGLRPEAITDPTQLHQLTSFFAWSAWAASTNRPGHDYSYTNNWPPEPRVENTPTANVIVWSVLSLIALLGGIGILFGVFGRWGGQLGWHGREQAALSFRPPGEVALTPAQRATAWFFFVMAALFLLQTFVGGASQHYRAEIDDFFGFDLAEYFPYNLMRTWHVQLATSGWRPHSSPPASSWRR
jgi:nitric oxide reductase subunit B